MCALKLWTTHKHRHIATYCSCTGSLLDCANRKKKDPLQLLNESAEKALTLVSTQMYTLSTLVVFMSSFHSQIKGNIWSQCPGPCAPTSFTSYAYSLHMYTHTSYSTDRSGTVQAGHVRGTGQDMNRLCRKWNPAGLRSSAAQCTQSMELHY